MTLKDIRLAYSLLNIGSSQKERLFTIYKHLFSNLCLDKSWIIYSLGFSDKFEVSPHFGFTSLWCTWPIKFLCVFCCCLVYPSTKNIWKDYCKLIPNRTHRELSHLFCETGTDRTAFGSHSPFSGLHYCFCSLHKENWHNILHSVPKISKKTRAKIWENR